MHRLVLTVVLACFSILAYCQNALTEVEMVGYKWNVGKFSKAKNPVRGAAYPFKNVGKQPLIIEKVEPTCICTIVKWDKQPIPPGGTGYVTVYYDGRKMMPGYVNKMVYVTLNTKSHYYRLYLEGEMTE